MIEEIVITPEMIILYVLIINLIGFLIMGLDKFKAKKGFWRTPEKTIFTITLLGGGIGTVTGMYLFRHKTKKPRFYIGFPVILILQSVLLIYLII